MTVKRIGYMGWLGHKNIGDEACFEAIKGLFPNQNIKWLTWDARAWKHGAFPDLCILGGGTLFDIRFDRRGKGLRQMLSKKVPIIIWGTGVMPLSAPKRPRVSKMNPSALNILKHAKFVGVRGPISYTNLASTGFTGAKVIGDPAIILSTNELHAGLTSNKIALNIGNTHTNLFGTEQYMVQEAKKLVSRLTADGFEVVLFPVWPQDNAFLKQIPRTKNVSLLPWHPSSIRLMNFFKTCRCVIGLKLHTSVLSAAANVPFISIAYREKCFDFAASVGLHRWAVRSDAPDWSRKVYKLTNRLPLHYDIIVNRLKAYQKKYHKKHVALSTLATRILARKK